jgi:hypothetical protein
MGLTIQPFLIILCSFVATGKQKTAQFWGSLHSMLAKNVLMLMVWCLL